MLRCISFFIFFSRLAFEIKVTKRAMSTRWPEYKHKKRPLAPNGFSLSLLKFSTSPSLYNLWRLPMVGEKFHIHHSCFLTAVLHSCGANVLYIQTKWLTPVWACLDFILWFFFSSKNSVVVLFGDSLMICFPQVFLVKRKTFWFSV